jgi:DNA-binding transcriptional LysR family regulator
MIKDQMFKKLQQVAQSGSLAKAADLLFISHSALVQQVKATEENLGFPIFYRTRKGIQLTPSRKIFLEEGDLIFKNYERLYQKCKDLAGHKPPAVTIGMLPDLRSDLLITLCRKYKEENPDANIVFKKSATLHEYFGAFLDGEFDITSDFMLNFAHNYLKNPGLGIIPCKPCRFSICVYKTDPLAGLNKVSFVDLRGKKLMMRARGVSKATDLLRDYLETHEPLIEILDYTCYGHEAILKAALENAVLLSVSQFNFDIPSVLHIPTDWDFSFERGFSTAKTAARRFKISSIWPDRSLRKKTCDAINTT